MQKHKILCFYKMFGIEKEDFRLEGAKGFAQGAFPDRICLCKFITSSEFAFT